MISVIDYFCFIFRENFWEWAGEMSKEGGKKAKVACKKAKAVCKKAKEAFKNAYTGSPGLLASLFGVSLATFLLISFIWSPPGGDSGPLEKRTYLLTVWETTKAMRVSQGMKMSSEGQVQASKGISRMFETSACKLAALKTTIGLDGPLGTLELRNLSNGEGYSGLKETGLYDLYDLVDKQKKVKINSFEALLNYQLCFTKVTTHLQVTNQLLSIKKDDLYLKGFDQEF
ncbi:hypothetical protein BKA83DRAFT_4127636 [Pisolithus microcarpus]|nr:hypothetical protein BKA83DRAFT_4127636 [Pisolithus microcarpus]